MALMTTGWTYRFEFIEKFAEFNGVYTITKVYCWDEVINDQLPIYANLYEPLHISAEIYNGDIESYKLENIYKLVSTEDGRVLYAPESIFSQKPVYPLKEYLNLVLFIPLGTYDDVEGLDYITKMVNEEIEGSLGITGKPQITAINKVYMTEKEYQELADKRIALRNKVYNWFTATKDQGRQIEYLKSQLALHKKLLKEKFNYPPSDEDLEDQNS